MEVAEYSFALFIFVLACAFALLCKYLFGRTKNRLQALDEKEKKLLALYSTLEDMMDEFNDSAVQANSELAQHITTMRKVAASIRSNDTETNASWAKPASEPQPAAATPVAAPALPPGNAMPQQRSGKTGFDAPVLEVIKETVQAAVVPPQECKTTKDKPAKAEPDRPARILDLHRNGMDRLHIARELSVTLCEVDLVLGIAGQR